ncbi:MAG: hypothetical protein FWG35_06245, partial [Spirochaetaceae bacterium]|nr:hypothetical protein [Spirochaetaceae bacterium]
MIENPLQRIFHIDTECYLIYVGNNPHDYRPFLRVGNSRFLPEGIKSFISAVVIPDSLTGNQTIEFENLEIPLTGETRYVGDPEAVARLKRFLEDNAIPSEAYADSDGDGTPPEKNGAFVYFFKNGNIQIFHDTEHLFDLREREKADSHFVYRAEKAVQAVKSNPFRYMPADLGPAGFFFSDGKPFFFREGKIGTLGISADYIRELGRYGFDPDILSWLVDDRISEGLLCRFKRATVTKKDIRVATLNLKKFQNAAALFTTSGLSCIIAHLERGEEKNFSGFTLRRREDGLAVAFPASSFFPEVMFPENADASDGHFLVEAVKTTGAGGGGFSPIEGIPYRILDGEEDPAALIRIYLLDVTARLKDMEAAGGLETLKTLETLCRALTAAPGSAAAKALSGSKSKDIASGAPQEFLYLSWNIHEFARLAAFRKGTPASLLKNAGKFASLVARPGMPGKNTTHFPVLGDLCRVDREWFVFYRWNGILSRHKLLQAQKSREAIEKLGVHDEEDLYVSERQRILDFIGSLTGNPVRKKKPVVPPGSPRQDRAEGASSRPAEEKPVSAAEQKSLLADSRAENKAARPSAAARDAGESSARPTPAAGTQGARSTVNKAKIGKFLLPALAVIALGGGAFLLLRGCPASAGAESSQPVARESSPEAGAPARPSAETPSGPGGQDAAASNASDGPGQTAGTPESGPAARDVPGADQIPGTAVLPGSPPAGSLPAGQALDIDPCSINIRIFAVFYCVIDIAVMFGYCPLGGTQ